MKRNSIEEEYVFSNNIYHYNNKLNDNFDKNNIYIITHKQTEIIITMIEELQKLEIIKIIIIIE